MTRCDQRLKEEAFLRGFERVAAVIRRVTPPSPPEGPERGSECNGDFSTTIQTITRFQSCGVADADVFWA